MHRFGVLIGFYCGMGGIINIQIIDTILGCFVVVGGGRVVRVMRRNRRDGGYVGWWGFVFR